METLHEFTLVLAEIERFESGSLFLEGGLPAFLCRQRRNAYGRHRRWAGRQISLGLWFPTRNDGVGRRNDRIYWLRFLWRFARGHRRRTFFLLRELFGFGELFHEIPKSVWLH